VREEVDNHRRLFDGGDDLQGAIVMRQCWRSNTRLESRPAYGRGPFIRVVTRVVVLGIRGSFVSLLRSDRVNDMARGLGRVIRQ